VSGPHARAKTVEAFLGDGVVCRERDVDVNQSGMVKRHFTSRLHILGRRGEWQFFDSDLTR